MTQNLSETGGLSSRGLLYNLLTIVYIYNNIIKYILNNNVVYI
jgi:hypothetical protein